MSLANMHVSRQLVNTLRLGCGVCKCNIVNMYLCGPLQIAAA